MLIATHDVDQARAWDRVLCLNGRQVAFGPPEATLHRAVLEATYGGEIVELPGGERRAVRAAPPPRPLMLAVLHTLTDPWARPGRPPRAARGRAARRDRRRARAAGSSSTASPTAPSRSRTRCCRGSSRGARGRAAAARRRRGPARRGARGRRSPGARRRSATTRRSPSSSPRCSALGALLALSPDTPARLQGLLFGDVLGVSTPTSRSPPASPRVVLGALGVLHAAAARRRLRPRSAPAALGRAPLVVDAALGVLVALAILVAVQGLGNLLVVAVLVAPGGGGAPADAADGADDGRGGGDRGRRGRRRAVRVLLPRTAGGASIAGALVLAYAAAHVAARRRARA